MLLSSSFTLIAVELIVTLPLCYSAIIRLNTATAAYSDKAPAPWARVTWRALLDALGEAEARDEAAAGEDELDAGVLADEDGMEELGFEVVVKE
jgi:hypothetical protein